MKVVILFLAMILMCFCAFGKPLIQIGVYLGSTGDKAPSYRIEYNDTVYYIAVPMRRHYWPLGLEFIPQRNPLRNFKAGSRVKFYIKGENFYLLDKSKKVKYDIVLEEK